MILLVELNCNLGFVVVWIAFASPCSVSATFCRIISVGEFLLLCLYQIDLKLKICRGTSVRKVLVREAKSFIATKVIVGIARNSHPIR